MDLTISSLLEWTKLFVRDPNKASALVKAAKLPVETSILMIVLAGVVSAAASGAHYLLIGSPDMIVPLSETQGVKVERVGPISQGIFAVVSGIGLGYAIYIVGRRMGGQGSLADILSITAVLQLVVTMIYLGVYVADLLVPIVGFVLMVLGLWVSIRGIAHTANVGHSFDNIGRAAWVVTLSLLALGFVLITVGSMLGLTPEGVLVDLELDQTL